MARNHTINEVLCDAGFHRNAAEGCLYFKHGGGGPLSMSANEWFRILNSYIIIDYVSKFKYLRL